jgi:DNA polymerase-3 subunit delta
MDAAARKVWKDMQAGKFEPVYLLQGEETFYIDQIADYIEANALPQADKSFNQVILYGKDVTVAQILTHARRFPMMAERQVVIVKEAQDITDLHKENGIRLMVSYLANPVPSTVLVLCHKYKTLDKRRELGKKAEQLTGALIFKKPYESQLPEFITEYVSAKGYQISDGAVQVLVEYVGNDLSRLANEVDKVLIDTPKEEIIKAERVMARVGISKEYNIFELQKALINRNAYQAARIVNYFVSNTKRNPPIAMVAFLYSFFSKLLIAVTQPGLNEKNLATALKISPFAARDYSIASRKFSREKVMENISLLKETDLKLKGVNSGNTSEGDIVKELIFRLI